MADTDKIENMAARIKLNMKERNIEFCYSEQEAYLKAPMGYDFKPSPSFGRFGDSVRLTDYGEKLLLKCEKLGGVEAALLIILEDLDHAIELEHTL